MANSGETLREPASEIVGHGHKGGRLIRSVSEHHALVAGTDKIERIGGTARLGIVALVHALRDIGALLVNHVDDAAGLAIETKLCAVVADAANYVASDLLHVDVCLGANLTGDDDGTGGDQGLARAANVLYVGGNAGRRNIAL